MPTAPCEQAKAILLIKESLQDHYEQHKTNLLDSVTSMTPHASAPILKSFVDIGFIDSQELSQLVTRHWGGKDSQELAQLIMVVKPALGTHFEQHKATILDSVTKLTPLSSAPILNSLVQIGFINSDELSDLVYRYWEGKEAEAPTTSEAEPEEVSGYSSDDEPLEELEKDYCECSRIYWEENRCYDCYDSFCAGECNQKEKFISTHYHCCDCENMLCDRCVDEVSIEGKGDHILCPVCVKRRRDDF